MTDQAKKPRQGGGSRRGIPNKATTDARQAIALFVDANAHRLQVWLDEIAAGVKVQEQQPDGTVKERYVVAPNPAKAAELFKDVIEYHVPKLARNELTGADGGPVAVYVNRRPPASGGK